MINVLFYCTARPGSEDRLKALLSDMQRVSRDEDRAVQYTFLQQKDNASEWALVEQWRDRAHLEAHVANMKKHFGDPPPGAQLPARMHELVASSRFTVYRLVD